jgi:uncharacterized protein YkwD
MARHSSQGEHHARRNQHRRGPRTARYAAATAAVALAVVAAGAAGIAGISGGGGAADSHSHGTTDTQALQDSSAPLATQAPRQATAAPTASATTSAAAKAAAAATHGTATPPAKTPARTKPAPSRTPARHQLSAGTPSRIPVDRVLALINQARATAGLPPYTSNSVLVASASQHNHVMVSGNCFEHVCPGEPGLGGRITGVGTGWLGENIGKGGPVAATDSAIAEMAVGLTQSMLDEKPPNDGHRQNILSSHFHHIGIALYRDSAGVVWMTQDFSD